MTTTNTDSMAEGVDDVVDLTDEPTEGVTTDDTPSAEQQPDEPTDATDSTDEPDESSKAGREAAKYRRRLRETETERDALAARVTDLQRDVVDGIVTASGAKGGRMHSAEAFWAGGVDVADLLDDAGNVDPAKVLEAADDVAKRFGITRKPKPNTVHGEGYNPRPRAAASMTDVVMGKRG